ncbi:MAG: ABC transporter ATP-binding protein [Anaerofustis sp.]
MKTIFRYLKSYGLIVALCLVLLLGQAVSDLSLPNLMSDIVNVGIQQGGITETAPQAISKNGMDLISFFMPDSERETIQSHYKLIEPNSQDSEKYLAEYPLLENNAIYVLSATDQTAIDQTGAIYCKAVYAFMLYMQDYTASQSSSDAASSYDTSTNSIDIDLDQLYQIIPYLNYMPASAFTDAINKAASTDSMFTKQVGIAFTGIFYKELGIDTSKIQSSYILNKGFEMVLITLAGAAASIGVGFFSARVAAGVAKRMRHDLFRRVESFSSHEFDQFSTASLITRSTNDVTQVQMLINMGIRMLCYAPILGAGGVIMAVHKSVSLSWIIAAAVILLLGIITVVFSVAMPKFKIIQKLIDRLNLVTRESLSGMMVIRAFGNQKYEEARFDKANIDLTQTNLFVNRVMVFMMPFMMLLMNGVTLLIVWIGGHQIADSAMQVGDMMAFMQYAMQIIFSFLMIAVMFIMVPRASVSASRIGEVLNTEPTILDPKSPVSFARPVKGLVSFNDVSFRFPNAESDVLEHITLTAEPGCTTAFIGSTGSGKSTLVNLIPRFYDVTEGSITIDGIDIRNVTQHDLREIIGYIPQKAVLFSGDIGSNIRYGKEDATDEEVRLAAKIAQAEDFIESDEEHYDKPIAQGGSNVSGGQKQRLSIARALAKNAPIYIFDDSFSALDFKTDAALRKALKTYTSDATVLIVAQRVSTIMDADKIIVLDDGDIVGIGTHRQLLKDCDVYREIAESQLSKEELA